MRGIACCLLLLAAPAAGQAAPDDFAPEERSTPHLRPLCSERPGLTTAACTVDPGHVQVEMGIANCTLDRQPEEREDRVEAGDLLLRYGLGRTTELQLGWIAYGHVRTLDRMTGAVDEAHGVGDFTLGLKQNLRHPAEGKTGFAMGLLPFVTLPIGDKGVGDGDWSAGLIVPLSYKVNDTVSLALSPEIEAAVDEDGSGRYMAYGAAFGMQVHLSETVRLSPELQFIRDEDPDEAVTMASASLSFDVQVQKMTQLDVQAVAGLNRDTPDLKLTFGVARKF